MKSIGLILPKLPGYSETFLIKKINGLSDAGFKIYLFTKESRRTTSNLSPNVKIIYQLSFNQKYKIPFILSKLILFNFKRLATFIVQEINSNRKIKLIIRNVLINAHILDQKLDWLHFSYATMAIGRENVPYTIGAKCAVSFRGYDITSFPNKNINCYNVLWKKLDKVHSISNYLYIEGMRLGLNKKTSTKIINPAVNTTFFKTKKNRILNEPIRILTVSRLNWIKGLEYSIKAVDQLLSKGIPVEYKIIGEGSYKEAIQYAINQLNLENSVFLLNKTTNEEVVQQMKWAEIYLQPSLQEGFCNATLEAQAMGLLCIVSNTGGLKENIKQNQTGWLVNKRSACSISKKIIDVLNMDNAEIYGVSNQAKQNVIKNYGLTKHINEWIDFYIN